MSDNLTSEKIFAVGQYDTSGQYMPYVKPQACSRFGNHLLDVQDGFAVAVLDEYGDWVSPVMKALGLKSKIEVSIIK